MRVIIQRVKSAKVLIDDIATGSIGSGLVLLLGVSRDDREEDAQYLVDKIAGLRIFADEEGKMNQDIRQAGGSLLIVSNFTVYGDTRKGRRPGFDLAASAAQAKILYEYFVQKARLTGIPVETGSFQAHMLVALENDGPITLICESPARQGT
jgi:D-tyrosyl-tRNA(Tyr) deacylase